jgi:DMSO reductase anchor subunit
MTTLIQAVAGAITYSIVLKQLSPLPLLMLLLITAFTLQISVFHLGRPAYAYRAAKMWRRSWLSREVLLFGLFFGALAALTAAAWLALLQTALPALRLPVLSNFVVAVLQAATILFGGAGIVASACIYLIPARPSWNMVHTPVDFIFSAALLGVPLPFILEQSAAFLRRLPLIERFVPATPALDTTYAGALGAGIAAAWLINLGLKVFRLKSSSVFEEHASYTLLQTSAMQWPLILSGLCIVIAGALHLLHFFLLGFLFAAAGVLLSRYLFFVSVVPLNMALTYVRRQAA